jgi:hypothetical protein
MLRLTGDLKRSPASRDDAERDMSRAGAPLRSAPELPPRWSLDDRADAVAEDDQPLVSFGLNSDRLFFIT